MGDYKTIDSTSAAEKTECLVPQTKAIHCAYADLTKQTIANANNCCCCSGRNHCTRQQLTFVTFCLVNFASGVLYSLLAPFFPVEASKKQISNTATGLIFGSYQLIIVLISPLLGAYATKIGLKFMFVVGVITCGFCTILFGLLERSPGGTVFTVLCVTERIFEGAGAAAFMTANFAILAKTYPDKVSSMFGTLELFTGVGLMAGPPIGGALFEAGGFMLPFVSLGGMTLIIGVVSIFLLPECKGSSNDLYQGSVISLCRIPLVVLMTVLLITGTYTIGFLDITLAIVLYERYALSPVELGAIFLVAPATYAISAPLLGFIGDKKPSCVNAILIFGFILASVSLFLVAPAPFFPFTRIPLWVSIIAYGLNGFGIGAIVLTFKVINETVREYGYTDSLGTYSLVSGLFTSAFSLGCFIGPLLGGYLTDWLHFAWAATISGFFTGASAVTMVLYLCVIKFWKQQKHRQLSEENDCLLLIDSTEPKTSVTEFN